MKKPTLYLWWIGLLMLRATLCPAQNSGINTTPLSLPAKESAHLVHFEDWVLKANEYFEQQAYAQAIPYFEHALRMKRKEAEPQQLIDCLINLSLAVAYDRQFERAKAHLEEANWHLQQEPPTIFKVKSHHLITEIRHTVDSLSGVTYKAAKTQSDDESSQSVFYPKLQGFFTYGASTGIIIFFFVFSLALVYMGKYRRDAAIEFARLHQILHYVKTQYGFEKQGKMALIAQNQRLAASVQDGLGNLIASVKLHVEQIEEEVAGTQPAKQITLRKISSWLEQACIDLRSVSQKLMNPELQENGLGLMLKEHKAYLLSAGFRKVKIFDEGLERGMNVEQESAVYGIIMTWTRLLALNDPHRSVWIHLKLDQDGLNLQIEDDGPEILIPKKKNTAEHILFADLKTRISALGGTIHIESSPKSGNSLVVELGGI